MPEVDDFAIVARIFNQLGDGTRLRILWLLCHSTECVSNIGDGSYVIAQNVYPISEQL